MTRLLTAALICGISAPAFAGNPEPRILDQATEKARLESSGRLTVVQNDDTDDGGKGGLFWTGVVVTAVSAVGLLATEQNCNGTRINDRCLGQTEWPAGQIGGWSGGLGAGILMMILD